jgi:glycosyltransferase involved in cell wall biosynthesis
VLQAEYETYLVGDAKLKNEARDKLNIYLENVIFLNNKNFSKINPLQRIITTANFDLLFFMTDGSLFFSFAGKNYLIIQSPLHIPHMDSVNKLKAVNWQLICYSEFMKKVLKKRTGLTANILSPGIDIKAYRNQKNPKENIILSVGRYFPYPHNKRHDFLIDVFCRNYKKHFSGWKLIIAGGLSEIGGKQILLDLQKRGENFPVELMVNLSFTELAHLYQKAKIYWHATGVDSDLIKYPEKAEHFGITTLEAMAAGAAPIVYGQGGQADIISENKDGFLWQTETDLINKTKLLISDTALLNKIVRGASLTVTEYNLNKFYEKLKVIIEE